MTARRRAALLALGVLLAVCPPLRAGAAEEPGPPRVLVIGDSLSMGSAGDATWRYRLAQHVPVEYVGPRDDLWDNVAERAGSQAYLDPAFDRDHAAYWGRMLAHRVSDPDEAPEFSVPDLVTGHDPDVLVVMLGFNDLLWAWLAGVPGSVSVESALAAVEALVAEARSVDPSVDLVLGHVPHGWFPFTEPFNAGLDALAATLDTPASRTVVAATDDGYTPATTWDGSHPDANGELVLAAAVADALAQLGVGTPYPRPLPTLPEGPRQAPALTAVSGDGSARLTWSGPPGATAHYIWLRDVTAGGAWQRLPAPIPSATSGPTSWQVDLLGNGRRYDVRLQPVKGDDEAASDVRSATVSVVPGPAQAPVVRAVAGPDGRLSVTWTPTAGTSAYSVRVRDLTAGTAYTTVATTPLTRVVTPGLVTAHRYRVAVRAVRPGLTDLGGTAETTVPRPRAVRDVRATSPRVDRVRVVGDPRPEATSYRVYAVRARSCATPPPGSAYRVVAGGLDSPRVTVRSDARALWVRVRAVRSGVAGALGHTSTDCVRVR